MTAPRVARPGRRRRRRPEGARGRARRRSARRTRPRRAPLAAWRKLDGANENGRAPASSQRRDDDADADRRRARCVRAIASRLRLASAPGRRPPRAAAACPNEPLPWPTSSRGARGCFGHGGELARQAPDRRVPRDAGRVLSVIKLPPSFSRRAGAPSEEVLPFVARPSPTPSRSTPLTPESLVERGDDRALRPEACRSRGRSLRHPSWPRRRSPSRRIPRSRSSTCTVPGFQ